MICYSLGRWADVLVFLLALGFPLTKDGATMKRMFKFLQQKLTPSKHKVLQVSKNFAVPLNDFVSTGERDAILASSGMGKSYLTGVILEETLENGTLVCIIDPEGEHFTLAERYPCLIIGGEHAHVPFDPAGVDLYIEAMITTGLSTIFDLSDFIDTEQQDYYAIIGDALFRFGPAPVADGCFMNWRNPGGAGGELDFGHRQQRAPGRFPECLVERVIK